MRSNFYSSARQLRGISVASSHHEALLVAVPLLIVGVPILLLQNIEIAIHYSAGLFLVGLALFVFASVNKVSGVLIGFFALYTLMMQMAFSNVWGLDFIVEIFLETTPEPDAPLPAVGAVVLGMIGGLSKISLAAGVCLLIRALKSKARTATIG